MKKLIGVVFVFQLSKGPGLRSNTSVEIHVKFVALFVKNWFSYEVARDELNLTNKTINA